MFGSARLSAQQRHQHQHQQQQVWYRHSQLSWSLGTQIGMVGDAMARVRGADGAIFTLAVPRDVHPFLPGHLEPLDNVARMNNLHEAPLLNLLRERYAADRIYTFSSDIVISINPYKLIDGLYDNNAFEYHDTTGAQAGVASTVNTGSKSVNDQDDTDDADTGGGQQKTKAKTAPPHVFTVADRAYQLALTAGTNQSIIVSGESGAGKTEACKRMMQRLAFLSRGCVDSSTSSSTLRGINIEQQVLECNPFLEAFGNAKTLRNDNSSRFGKFIRIQYAGNRITGVELSHYLLETPRLVRQTSGERNFHIFFQMAAGATTAECAAWQMLPPKHAAFLSQGVASIDNVDDESDFHVVRTALSTVGIGSITQAQLFATLAGILQLGNVGFEVAPSGASGGAGTAARGRSNSSDAPAAQVVPHTSAAMSAATELLGVPELEQRLLRRRVQSRARSSMYLVDRSPSEAADARDALAKVLYGHVFDWLVGAVNGKLSCQQSSVSHVIGMLDIFGFEIFELNSFEQLCINYANEKLQNLFNHHVFVTEHEMYTSEGVDASHVRFQDNGRCVALLEERPFGVLPLLDEVCALKDVEGEGHFLSALCKHQGAQGKDGGNPHFVASRFAHEKQFDVVHFAGQVTYSIDGFVEKNRDQLHADLRELMRASLKPFVVELFADDGAQEPNSPMPLEAAPPDNPRLGRSASGSGSRVRGRTLSQSRLPTKTIASQFKAQLTMLVDGLKQTQAHYVRCVKPNTRKAPSAMDAPLVLEQLLYSGVLETVRIRCMGYPRRETFEGFWRKCVTLGYPQHMQLPTGEEQPIDIVASARALLTRALPPIATCQPGGQQLLEHNWQLGYTRVFLKRDGWQALHHWYLSSRVLPIQRQVRGVVTRMRVKRYAHSIVVLQRRWVCKLVQRRYAHLITQCIVVQNWWTARLGAWRQQRNRAARLCGAAARGWLVRLRQARWLAARKIQATVRRYTAACRALGLRRVRVGAAQLLQAWGRAFIAQRTLHIARRGASRLQALARGTALRAVLLHQIAAVIVLQRLGRRVVARVAERRRTTAASAVQRLARGRAARVRVHERRVCGRRLAGMLSAAASRRLLREWLLEAHAAAGWGDTESLRALLACEDPRYRVLRGVPRLYDVRSELEGRSLVHAAARAINDDGAQHVGDNRRDCGAIATLELVLGAGADVDARDSCGQSALHLAVGGGDAQIAIARILLARSKEPQRMLSRADAMGRMPLDVALDAHEDNVRSMVPGGAGSSTSGVVSVVTGFEATIQWLADCGAPSAHAEHSTVAALASQLRGADVAVAQRKATAEAQHRKDSRALLMADPRYQLRELQRRAAAAETLSRCVVAAVGEGKNGTSSDSDGSSDSEGDANELYYLRKCGNSFDDGATNSADAAQRRSSAGDLHRSRQAFSPAQQQRKQQLNAKTYDELITRIGQRARKASVGASERMVIHQQRLARAAPNIAMASRSGHGPSTDDSQVHAMAAPPVEVVGDAAGVACLRRLAQHWISEEPGRGCGWYYRDDSGGLQGPFPEHWMRSWVQAGHLLPDHEVSSCATGPLVTIRQLFPDVSRAFLSSTAFDLKQARHCIDLLLRSLAQNSGSVHGEMHRPAAANKSKAN